MVLHYVESTVIDSEGARDSIHQVRIESNDIREDVSPYRTASVGGAFVYTHIDRLKQISLACTGRPSIRQIPTHFQWILDEFYLDFDN
jgi:hypothetical protein